MALRSSFNHSMPASVHCMDLVIPHMLPPSVHRTVVTAFKGTINLNTLFPV